MTERKSISTSSVGSDGSLVLIESADIPPPTTELGELVHSEEAPDVISETFSYDSQEELEQQGAPLIATDVQIVNAIPSSMSPVPYENGEDANEDDELSKERKVGAGIAVGIVAAPFFGPVLAVIAGVAAAYGTSQPGATGDACRAAGDIALIAREKAFEVDKKHDLVNKTKDGANQIIDRARDTNERHQIFENVKKIMACTFKNIAVALQFAAEKMKESNQNRAASNESTEETHVDETSYEKVSVVDMEGK